jgi:hypothetical protein
MKKVFERKYLTYRVPWHIKFLLIFCKPYIGVDCADYGKSAKYITVFKRLFGKIYCVDEKFISLKN